MVSDNAQRLNEFIQQHNTILFVASRSKKFDTLPACWALANVVRAMGHRAKIFFPGTLPPQLSFLDFRNIATTASSINAHYTLHIRARHQRVEHVQYIKKGSGVRLLLLDENNEIIPASTLATKVPSTIWGGVVIVGTTTLNELPLPLRRLIEQKRTPVLFIAPRLSREWSERKNVISGEHTSSCSELITRILKEIDEERISPSVATALMTGLVAATQNFQHASVRPQTLFAAAYLIGRKADKNTIIRHLYKTKPFSFVKLWGYALSRFSYDPATRICWTMVDAGDFTRSGATRQQAGELLAELKNNFSQANTFVLGIENSTGNFSVLIHTSDTTLLKRYANRFGARSRNSTLLIALPHRQGLAEEIQALISELQRIIL